WNHDFNFPFARGCVRALTDSNLRFEFAMMPATHDGSDVKALKAQFIDPNPLATLEVAGRTLPFELTAEQTAIANDIGVKLHVHLNEHISEASDPTFESLEAAGSFAMGRKLIGAHAVHITDAQLAKLAASGTVVSHQPLSNMRLASGIMRY